MSVTTTYTGVRIVDMPDLGAFTDASSVVGERSGSGRFSALSMRNYIGIAFDLTNGNASIASPFNIYGGPSGLDSSTFGVGSGAYITSRNCTGFGYAAIASVVGGTARGESAFGSQALMFDQTGLFNSAFGSNAGLQLTTGNANVFFGHGCVAGNDFTPVPMTGSQNSMYGNWAGQNFVTSTGNCGLGEFALYSATDGNNNVAIGTAALGGNTTSAPSPPTITASNNVAIGTFAMRFTTGDNQIGIGYNAMLQNLTGIESTAVGTYALSLSQHDFRNTAIGYFALQTLNGGGSNTAIGAEALIHTTTGSANTAVGSQVGAALSTGSNNTIIGFGVAPTLDTGSDNIIIGNSANADVLDSATSNTLIVQGIGSPAIVGVNLNSAGPTVRFPGSAQVGAAALTLEANDFGMQISTLIGELAPGPNGVKLVVAHGTNPGTAKLLMYAGTSTTPTVIADNVGAGVV